MKTIIIIIALLLHVALPAIAQNTKSDSSKSRCPINLYVIDGNPCYYRLTISTVDINAQAIQVNKWVQGAAVLNSKELSAMPIRDVNDALSLFAGVYQKRRGAGLCVEGGRPEGNLYVIDGMRILPW